MCLQLMGVTSLTSSLVMITRFLMTVIEEKRGESRDEPHAIYTPLGWLASGGRAVFEWQCCQ